jgi:hypothetical protein
VWLGGILQLTDKTIEELGVDNDARYLFWTVVQAVKDYVFFARSGNHRYSLYHRLARKWIFTPDYEVKWGDGPDPPRFTFGEALEMLGVHSENVDVFRTTIKEARFAKTDEERKKIVMSAYSKLHFHDNEPELWRCLGGSIQVSSF